MPVLHRVFSTLPCLLILTSVLSACSGSSGSNPPPSDTATTSTALSDHPLERSSVMAFFSDHQLVIPIPDDHALQEHVFAKVASSNLDAETVHFLGEISPELSNGAYTIEITLNLPETITALRYQIFSTPEPRPLYQGEVML